MSAARVTMALLFLACALPADLAKADGRETNQRALKLAYEADDLYARGQWEPAYARFAEADLVAHSPVFVLYMARCRKNAGRLLEAGAIYTRLSRERVGADAPKPFHDAVASAVVERDEVQRRTPLVRISVTGAGAANARVAVDGHDVANPEIPLALDPGMHAFEATADGDHARKEITLADGARDVRVVLALHADERTERTPEPARPSMAPAIAALSLGTVSAIVGGVTFAMASSKASAIKANCVDGHCLRSDGPALDDARRLATVSTVAFVTGGVGLATAGVLFFVLPRRSADASPPRAAAEVGPGWIGVRGAF